MKDARPYITRLVPNASNMLVGPTRGADIPVCLRPKVGQYTDVPAVPAGRQECLPHFSLLPLLRICFIACFLLIVLNTNAQPTDWPHPRGGLGATGVAEVSLADAYGLKWTYATGAAVLSSPVVADGVVYVSSEDKHLHAIDATTGKAKWTFAAESLIDASPVFEPGVVGAGLVYVGTDGGVLHAVDAGTGKELWQFKTEGRIAGEAGVVSVPNGGGMPDKVVLIGSHDGRLYCLDAATGKKKWDFETEDYINCGVCLDGGLIVLGGCDTFLHVIDLKTGKGLGKVELGGEVSGTPALIDDHAYLGHMQNEVVAVDVKEKTIAWRFHDRDFPFAGSPAVTEDLVLIGSQGRRLYCLDRKTGKQRWAIRTHGGIDGAPVIARGRAVFGSAGGRLSIIDLKQGETVWQYDIGASIDAGPAVTDKLIVVGAEDGKVYAFEPSNNP